MRKENMLKERERKRKWRKEKDAEEAKQLVREVEKLERKEKKKMLEKRWALMRWVAGFIEENIDRTLTITFYGLKRLD